MPGFHIEHVMMKYLINHKRGGGGGGGGGFPGPTPKSALAFNEAL